MEEPKTTPAMANAAASPFIDATMVRDCEQAAVSQLVMVMMWRSLAILVAEQEVVDVFVDF